MRNFWTEFNNLKPNQRPWCGNIVYWNEDDDSQVWFDFPKVTKPILTIAATISTDLVTFADAIRTAFEVSIIWSDDTYPGWFNIVVPGNMARMLAAGYYDAEPFLLEIKVEKVDSLVRVSANRFIPTNDLRAFSGSLVVEPGDELSRAPNSVEEASDLIREYIKRSG
jgi:hypothetical protein